MAAKHPEDVLEVAVNEEEQEELLTVKQVPVTVAKMVENEERRSRKKRAAMRYAAMRYELEDLWEVVPGYDEKLGLVKLWMEDKKAWGEKFGHPAEKEQSKRIWMFWRRHGFPEGFVEAMQRFGTGSGRQEQRLMEAEKKEQAWTKQCWFYRVRTNEGY